MVWGHAYYFPVLRGKFNLATIGIFKFLNCKKPQVFQGKKEKNPKPFRRK